MPWVAELKQEEDAKMKELVKLGLMDEKEFKKLSKNGAKEDPKAAFKQKKLFSKDDEKQNS